MVAPIHGGRSSAAAGRRPAPLRADRGWLTSAAVAKSVGGTVRRGGRTGDGVVTDTRQDCTGKVFVALRGENHDGHDHIAAAVSRGAVGLVVDQRIAERLLPEGVFVVKAKDTRDALMGLAASHRRRSKASVVGITGSCGKTSTKEMLGKVLDGAMPTVRSPASFNNQVGVPLTLFQLDAGSKAAVVEIGTSGPGEIDALSAVASPDIGIVTCVSQAHLSGLGDLAGVAKEKADLLRHLPKNGVAILNGDDPACLAMAPITKAKVEWVRLDREADWFATDVRFSGMGTCFKLNGERPVTLPRLGTHNVYNALFTIAAARRLGVDEDHILEALSGIRSADRRLECKQMGGVMVFDDTYNMNPTSARAALQALAGMPGEGRRVVVFGEMHELGRDSEALHRELGQEVARTGQDLLVCVGAGARPIAVGARAGGMAQAQVCTVPDPSAALMHLVDELRAGDRLLCKASRKVALDRLVDGLAQRFAPRGVGLGVGLGAGANQGQGGAEGAAGGGI